MTGGWVVYEGDGGPWGGPGRDTGRTNRTKGARAWHHIEYTHPKGNNPN